MIDPEMRKAIYQVHLAGMPQRQISRQFQISRDTVSQIIRQRGVRVPRVRKDKIHVEPELLQRLYGECGGWLQRVHEKLVEEEGIEISYPTLTRLARQLGIGRPTSTRCQHVGDEPGAEMQHDTTDYQIRLGDQLARLIASLLYFRYSKARYLKFYRRFNRFRMKSFFHEALMFWKRSAKWCIIDNTNLARLRGSGKRAIIVPEMAAFAERYGFEFICHALGHPNRKAGEERSFWIVETNFLPYWEQPRGTDEYGYVSVEGNYYWVPGTQREDVKILLYADHVKIYQQQTCLVEYPLPVDGVKNARFSPPGQPAPRHLPKHRKHGSQHEEQRLRALDPSVGAYLDCALQTPGIQRHRFVRELFALSRQVTQAAFVQALQRALQYRVVELQSLKNTAWFCLSQGEVPLAYADLDESFCQRPAYEEGALTDEPDLSLYDDLEHEDLTNPSENEDD